MKVEGSESYGFLTPHFYYRAMKKREPQKDFWGSLILQKTIDLELTLSSTIDSTKVIAGQIHNEEGA